MGIESGELGMSRTEMQGGGMAAACFLLHFYGGHYIVIKVIYTYI